MSIFVEGVIDEMAIKRVAHQFNPNIKIGTSYGMKGKDYLREKVNGLNKAAAGCPFLVLTDLDKIECVPMLITDWFETSMSPNLLFCVAVREVESWLLGDRFSIAEYLGINESLIPENVDEVSDPKEFILNLARRSRRQNLKHDLLPRHGSTAKIGPNYNGQLINYIRTKWDPQRASNHSSSLHRTIEKLRRFEPIWE